MYRYLSRNDSRRIDATDEDRIGAVSTAQQCGQEAGFCQSRTRDWLAMHRETWRSDDLSTFHGIALVNDLGGVCMPAAKQSRTGTLVGTIIEFRDLPSASTTDWRKASSNHIFAGSFDKISLGPCFH